MRYKYANTFMNLGNLCQINRNPKIFWEGEVEDLWTFFNEISKQLTFLPKSYKNIDSKYGETIYLSKRCLAMCIGKFFCSIN